MLEQPGRTQIRSENFTAKRPGIAGWQPTLCSRAANQHPPGILQRFPKLLAKIAHGFAMAEFDEGMFSSLLPPLILGHSDLLAHLVGGQMELEPPTSHMHEIGFGLKRAGEKQY